jgi:hypothetical protein
VFLDVNVDVQAITVLVMEIMFMIKGMLMWAIIITSGIRAVMGFGTLCKASDPKHKCSSRWNSSAFHIAVSHSTNPNQMFAWMPVVQALTQHPIIDWIGYQGLLRMQRTCFAKLIVGQSAALHLYNDHRLLPFPSYYPHPEFDVAGLCVVSNSCGISVANLLLTPFAASLIRCVAINLEESASPTSPSMPSPLFVPFGGMMGTKGPSGIVVGLIGIMFRHDGNRSLSVMTSCTYSCYVRPSPRPLFL